MLFFEHLLRVGISEGHDDELDIPELIRCRVKVFEIC